MPVKKGNYVKVEYTGTLDDGTVFDSTDKHGEPLGFSSQMGQMIKGFDDAVVGMEIGEEKNIHLEPEEAYGPRNPEAIQKFPKAQLPPDMKVEVGMILQMAHKHGDHTHQVPAEVVKVEGDTIELDLNHPMAGKTLNFKIKVVEILEKEP
jgi:FKBP-type peptidyl-prolyl cis-trans isomerase 2